MSFSPSEKKSYDVEMGEANSALPTPRDCPDAVPRRKGVGFSLRCQLSFLHPRCRPRLEETRLALQLRPSRRGDVPLAQKGSPRDLCRNIVPRFFVSLIDGMLSDCGSDIERSTRGLAESREALKQAEAALKSTEAAHAAELSQLEVWVSDLERDLGKSASALFKLKKEKKSKASEVCCLQREIQNQEESRTVVSRVDFHARLTRMAVLLPTGTLTRSSLSCSSSAPSRRVRERPRGKAPWLKKVGCCERERKQQAARRRWL
uniref:Uncharacterized protein n=1 Tax=Brassica oleracea TaxID=3712 RepID=A0A3P6CPA7_BRAOL|nr:unnamed protein product [Brassica oleracea]